MKMLRYTIVLALALSFTGCATKQSARSESSERAVAIAESVKSTDPHGQGLVKKLLDPKTRSRAFYELRRRAGKGEYEEDDWKMPDYDSFIENHYDPEVVVCPQEGGKPPIYVVLYGFLSRDSVSLDDGYQITDPSQLFPPLETAPKKRSWDIAAIDAFTATGRRVAPFGGHNCLEKQGILADINGDGLVERVEHLPCGVDGVDTADVLLVEIVKEEAERIFAVLYNWGEDEWDYRVTDVDKDKIFDIELGPKTPKGIKKKVVYTWDRRTRKYVGPIGKKGDHYRVLDTTSVWKEFKRLKREKTKFPKDPDFVDEHDMDDGPWARKGKKKPSPKEVSKPYRYASLQALTNKELVHYMGKGKNMYELEWDAILKTRVPEDFWKVDPKSAALSTADVNRYPAHQQRFRLAIDDRDGRKPPAVCSVSFSYASARCYNAIDCHYFLRVDPNESYLAYVRSWEGGVVFYNFVHNRPAYDFRFCKLAYEEAKHIAHAIWWLDRVRSRAERSSNSSGMMSSTADGRGTLIVRSKDGNELISVSDTIWAGQVSERWREDYDRETLLNLGAFLITSAFPERLGERWSTFEQKHSHDVLARQKGAPQYAEEELKRLRTFTEKFLNLFSADQTKISYAIVAQATRAVGDLTYSDMAEKLRSIQQTLPPSEKKMRTYKEVQAEIDKIDDKMDDPKAYRKLRDKRSALHKELMSILNDTGANRVSAVQKALDISLKKLRATNDPDALQKWASSKDPGCQWALQQLRGSDKKRYVASLEWWLKNTKEKWVRQVFEEMTQIDPQHAAELAKKVPPEKKGDLTVSAFAHLGEINGIPDEEKRVEALIKIVLDPKSGWQERAKAIELLVPEDNPHRYPSKKIDKAMLRLFDPKLADDVINFTLEKACSALARRGQSAYFGDMEKRLKKIEDGSVYHGVLGALTHLAQTNPSKYNPRLLGLLRPELKKTDKMMTEILWVIWAADLKELKPKLEALATSSPDDYQDKKANSHGGGITPVEGRFHLARKIVAMWNEEDPATKTKLILAFGFHDAYHFVSEPEPERLYRMKQELGRVAKTLSPEENKEVRAFLKWYESEHAPKEQGYRERRLKFGKLARELLGGGL